MDSVSVTTGLWAVVLLLPVVLTTALCLGCKKRPLTRIPQNVANYESNSPVLAESHRSLEERVKQDIGNGDDDENNGYIQVIPEPRNEQLDDQESISSGDSVKYINLGKEICKHCGASGQNVREGNEQDSQGQSLEYVNLKEEEVADKHDDNEEEMSDYVNIENSYKGQRCPTCGSERI